MIYFKFLIISLLVFVGVFYWSFQVRQNNLLPITQIKREVTQSATPSGILSPSPTPTKKASVTKVQTQIPTQAPIYYEVSKLHGGTIFNLINNYRQSKSLWTLNVSDELCVLAEKRVDFLMANDMAAAKASVPGNHVGLYDQVQSYSGTGIAENFVSNAYTDQEVLTAWQNSPPHNKVILSTKTEREDQRYEDRTDVTKGCMAVRVKGDESRAVLLVGDK